MARINPNTIRRSERTAQRRYMNYGAKRVYSALLKTIDPNNPEKTLDPTHIQKAVEDIYIYAGLDSAKREYNRLSREEGQKAVPDFFLNTWARWIRDYVRTNLGQMIVDITDNTRDKINAALQEGIEAGETRTSIAKRIRDRTLGEVGKRRARTIARTESQTATNIGKEHSAEEWARETGTRLYKIWIHMANKDERRNHVAMERKPPVPKDQPFQIDGDGGTVFTNLPAAVTLPAKERINCNCVAVFISERKARKDYGLQ